MHPNKQKNILNLSSEDRYGYLIRRAADFEEVWFILENGQYVTLGNKEEQILIPVWPEEGFAKLMLTDDWRDCSIESMNVHDFIDWLDTLEEDGCRIAGFLTTDLKSIVVSAVEMKNHLVYELEKY